MKTHSCVNDDDDDCFYFFLGLRHDAKRNKKASHRKLNQVNKDMFIGSKKKNGVRFEPVINRDW